MPPISSRRTARRARRVRTAARPVVGALIVLFSSAACARDAGPDRGRFAGVELAIAQPKPDFTLTATDGAAFDFRRETDGRLTLLFFGFTSCPDICPVHLANLAAALKKVDREVRERTEVVVVTTDPERDTPERLRQWLDNFDRSFVGLRGSREEVNRIEQAVGVAPSMILPADANDTTYNVGHAAQIIAFTPDDSLRVLYPFGVRQQDWAEDLPKLVRIGP